MIYTPKEELEEYSVNHWRGRGTEKFMKVPKTTINTEHFVITRTLFKDKI